MGTPSHGRSENNGNGGIDSRINTIMMNIHQPNTKSTLDILKTTAVTRTKGLLRTVVLDPTIFCHVYAFVTSVWTNSAGRRKMTRPVPTAKSKRMNVTLALVCPRPRPFRTFSFVLAGSLFGKEMYRDYFGGFSVFAHNIITKGCHVKECEEKQISYAGRNAESVAHF